MNNKKSIQSLESMIIHLEVENRILKNHNDQLNVILDEWYKSFDANQLNHVIDRLDVVEKQNTLLVKCKLVGADVSTNTIELQLPIDTSPRGMCIGDNVSVRI